MPAPDRLTVGIVGAGRVGAVLGAALARAGHQVVAASGQSEESRTRADALLPGVPLVAPDEVVRDAQLVLVTIPDDDIAPFVAGLAALGAFQPGQIVAHVSGRLGLEALAPAAAAGAITIALHPAMTFTGTSLDLDRLEGATMAVTASAVVLPIAQALAIDIGAEPVVVPDASRAAYHAALVHGANHVAATVSGAASVLADLGIDNPGRLLRPLVEATLEGALAEEPGSLATLTGPVVRGDVGTIASHLTALEQWPEVRDAYAALAAATARGAFASGRITARVRDAVLDTLAG